MGQSHLMFSDSKGYPSFIFIHLMKAPGRHSINSLRFMALGFSPPHSQISSLMPGLCYYFCFRPPLVVTFPLFLFSRSVIGPILLAVGESQQNRDSVSSHTLTLIAIVITSGRQTGHVETLPLLFLSEICPRGTWLVVGKTLK